MKKSKTILMLFFIVSLFITNKVDALEANVNLNCNKYTINAGEQSTCDIIVSVNSGSLSSFAGQVSLSDNLELVSAISSDSWEGNGNDGNFQLYTDTLKEGNVSIGKVTVKVKSGVVDTTEVLKLTDIILGDEDFNDQNQDDVQKEIKVPKKLDDNANLKSLTVSVGTLSPSFSEDVTNYTVVDVKSATIILGATAGNNASITGIGVKELKYGQNTFDIVVKAEAGNTKTYSIVINRIEDRSSDTSIKKISVNGTSLDLVSGIKNYKVQIPSSDDAANVIVEPNHDKAEIKYNGNNAKLSLGETSTVSVYVVAENGTTATYNITVTRQDNRSNNNTLKTLTFNGKNIALTNTQSNAYTLTVNNDVTSADVKAVSDDANAKVEITGVSSLKVGSNIFTIKVTAENESIRTYKLTVIRKNASGDITNLSNNAFLKSLTISNYNINFDKDVFKYNLEVENNVSKLNIKYVVEDSKAQATMDGSTELKEGLNTINILVIAENGETSTYVIQVTRKAKNYEVENKESSIISALNNKTDFEQVVVKVSSGSNLVIPNNIIKAIINSKKRITYSVIENSTTKYSLTLNGSLFTNYSSDVNYKITFNSNYSNDISSLIGSKKNIILALEHDGALPTGTEAQINVSNTFASGNSLYMYYYNENGALELQQKDLIVVDGNVTVPLKQGGSYVLLNTTLEDDTSQSNIPNENSNIYIYIIGGILVVGLVIAVIIIFIKKKKTEPKDKIQDNKKVSTDINSIEVVPSNISLIDDIDIIDIDEENQRDVEYLFGISVMDIDDYLEKCPLAGLKNNNMKEGIVLISLEQSSPLLKTGIVQGDVLLEFNGQKITNKETFKKLTSNIKHGVKVSIKYYQNGVEKIVEVTV